MSNEKFSKSDVERVPIAIFIGDEVVGYVHDIDYIRPDRVVDKDDNLARNKEELIALRKAIIENNLKESTISKVGNGRLITDKDLGIDRSDKDATQKANESSKKLNERLKRQNIPTQDALPDKNLIITVANNGVIDPKNIPANSIILNEKSITTGKGNNFKNGMFALIPVNKTNELGYEQIKYIAAPLSPRTLDQSQADTLSTLIEMFLKNQSKSFDSKDAQDEFDIIAKAINSKMSYRHTKTDQQISFNPASLVGLRNVIKLFTYDRVSLRDDLGVDEQKSNTKMIFGINQVNDKMLVVSFGTPGNVQSYKMEFNDKTNQFEFKIKYLKEPGWEKIDPNDFFSDLKNNLSSHLQKSFFYHNKMLMERDELEIPTIETVDGKSSVKFTTKTYPEFIKDNTQTNLRSVDLGDGNYSYTVQRNIIFDTPKVEEAKPKEVKPKETPKVANVVVENKIEEKSEEDKIRDRWDAATADIIGRYGSESEDGKSALAESDSQYKTELEGLKKSEVKPVEAKPQQNNPLSEFKPRGRNKSSVEIIDVNKEIPSDFSPNFEGNVDAQASFKTDGKSENLGGDFISHAKSQETDIKRNLIAMNRNGEIEVKCKQL